MLQEALELKIRTLLSKSNDKVIAQIVSLAKQHNVAIEDIAAAMSKAKGKSKRTDSAKAPHKAARASDKCAKVAPKYRSLTDSELTWTARGRTPLWVQTLKDAGTLDTALIATVRSGPGCLNNKFPNLSGLWVDCQRCSGAPQISFYAASANLGSKFK